MNMDFNGGGGLLAAGSALLMAVLVTVIVVVWLRRGRSIRDPLARAMWAIARLDDATLALSTASLGEQPKRGRRLRRTALEDGRLVARERSARWCRLPGRWAPVTVRLPDGGLAGIRWVRSGEATFAAFFESDGDGTRVVLADGVEEARDQLLARLRDRFALAAEDVRCFLPSLPALARAAGDRRRAVVLRPRSGIAGEPVYLGPDADTIAVWAGKDGIVLPVGGGHVIGVVRARAAKRCEPALAYFDSREEGREVRPFAGDPVGRAATAVAHALVPHPIAARDRGDSKGVSPFRAARRWALGLTLCAVSLLLITDLLIVNVALIHIARDLGTTITQLTWIVGAGVLALASALIAAGTIGDRVGPKRMIVGGLVVFGLASGLAAYAGSTEVLIAARFAQGLAAAAILPNALSVIRAVFRNPRERKVVAGLWTACGAAGVALGPVLGGSLLAHYWWGSVFLINLPIVAVLTTLAAVLAPNTRPWDPRGLDGVGIVLAAASMASLSYGLIEAPDRGWTSVPVLTGLAVAACGFATWLAWERGAHNTMIDWAWFRDRRFLGGDVAVTAVYLALMGTLVLATLYLQVVLGYSALDTGWMLAPVAGAIVVGAFLATALHGIQPWLRIAAGLALCEVGLLMFGTLAEASGASTVITAEVIIGLGAGVALATGQQSVLDSLPPGMAGVGSAVCDSFRHAGSTLSIAIASTIVSTVYRDRVGSSSAFAALPADQAHVARDSLAGAGEVAIAVDAAGDPGGIATAVRADAFTAHVAGQHAWAIVATSFAAAGVVAIALIRPRHKATSG